MQALVLSLDQGTTSTRALVWDLDGNRLAGARRPLRCRFPSPGLVEQDPEEIWESVREAGIEALAAVPADAVAAVGITNQRETTLLWDRRSGRALHPAIVWQDRRTQRASAALREQGLEPLFAERTGLVLDPYFSGTKLAWLLEHLPGARARAEAGELAFGTVDSWLLFRLTGGRVHATDPSNASRTLLWNIHTCRWDPELLKILGIPPEVLPEVRPTAGFFGRSADSVWGRPLPVTALVGDQQAALFGQGCLQPGSAKNTYGTGAFLVAQAGERVPAAPGLVATVAWQLGGQRPRYALEASAFVAGAALDWLRDGLGLVRSAAEVSELAATVSDAAGVYFVPALTGLGAPHWDPGARGLIIGLSRGSGRAHIARATLEALACQTRDAVVAMAKAGLGLTELAVDGGVAASDLFLQLQADVLGVPVVRSEVLEATSLGAARLAAIGAGLGETPPGPGPAGRRFLPAAERGPAERLYAGWQRACERAMGWEQG